MEKDETNNNSAKKPKTKWHRIFAGVMKEWLTPVNIDVFQELPLTVEPQKIDVLLLKHDEKPFTPEQLCRLADGLRDSKAQHLLLEFKYTESFGKDAIKQIMGYEKTYRTQKEMTEDQVDSFLLCSQSPQPETLRNFGYTVTEHQGIYRNSHPVLADTLIISLNDLSNAPHNIPLKVFASKMRVKQLAFEAIENNVLKGMSLELELLFEGLHEVLFDEGESYMSKVDELTTDYIKEIGRNKIDHILSVMPAEELVKRLTSDDVISGFSDEELQRLKEKLNKI